ncbi:hypothetical protein HDU89_000953 [Geranomyces variabilis]|nr:hypothetical protein HDU89_000953 [Geranomyces variabilis]
MAAPSKTVIVYLDNSNVFISAQQHAAKKYKFVVPDDWRCRIDQGKLVRLACSGRTPLRAKLYGSEPPALDTVWKSIRSKFIEVDHFKRSTWNNREKQVDGTLIADAVEDMAELKHTAGPERAVIVFSGDEDMLPVFHKARKHKWATEIWSFRLALANKLLAFQKEYPSDVNINYIDDYFEQVSFTNSRWNDTRIRIPADRTMVLSFETMSLLSLPVSVKKTLDRTLTKAVEESSIRFRVPTMACWCDLNPEDLVGNPGTRTDGGKQPTLQPGKPFYFLALICVPPEKDKNSGMMLYDFNKLYSNREKIQEHFSDLGCVRVQTFLEYKQGIEATKTFEASAGREDFEQLEDVSEISADEFATEMAPDWLVVAPRQRRQAQQYSDLCVYDFRCRNRMRCLYKHSPEQKQFFKEHQDPQRRRHYKTKPCWHEGRCRYKTRSHLCPYAHGLIEATCGICGEKGAHWMDECESASTA